MPSANDEDETLDIPVHKRLELVNACVQPFNKWSRRLLTYRKRSAEEGDTDVGRIDAASKTELDIVGNGLITESENQNQNQKGTTADDLNTFRKRYFQGFKNREQIEAREKELSVPRNRVGTRDETENPEVEAKGPS